MQQGRGEERREFQRLNLDPPIPGTYGTTAVSILEVGVLGARLQHADPFPSPRAELRFSYADGEIAMRGESVRTFESTHTKYPGAGLESGIRFVAAIGESGDHLRAMLADLVQKALQNRGESSASRLNIKRPLDPDKTVRGRDAQFTSYRLEDRGWKKRAVFLPEQPAAGFTVARDEDPDEMRRLCEVYEASDGEGRRLIRLFAELSVSSVLQIPPSG
jgi:hypothetical protein